MGMRSQSRAEFPSGLLQDYLSPYPNWEMARTRRPSTYVPGSEVINCLKRAAQDMEDGMLGHVRIYYALASFIFAASAAHAGELLPMEAKSVSVGDLKGVAYYTIEKDGFQVVATMESSDSQTPIRFVATLLPGQKSLVSVPQAIDQPELVLEFMRVGDRIAVSAPNLSAIQPGIQRTVAAGD